VWAKAALLSSPAATTSVVNPVLKSDLILKLKERFQRMNSPAMRNNVFENGAIKGRFFVAQGWIGQTVGLTKDQAFAALKLISGGASSSNVDITTPHSESMASSNRARIYNRDPGVPEKEALVEAAEKPSICKNATVPEKLISSQIKVATAVKPKRALLDQRDEVGNPVTTNLYVHGYGSETSKTQIQSLFSRYTRVVDVHFKYGYSFVHTSSCHEAILARHKLNGTELNGGTLTIRFAKEFKIK